MDEFQEEFLRSGLSRYAEARATVLAYEALVKQKLADIAEAAFGNSKLVSSPSFADAKFTTADDGRGRAAYVNVSGKLQGKNVTWQVGIWWEQPAPDSKTAIYAECRSGPAALKDKWAVEPVGKPREKWFAYGGGMHLVVSESTSLDEAFSTLLTEIERQAPVPTARTA